MLLLLTNIKFPILKRIFEPQSRARIIEHIIRMYYSYYVFSKIEN